MVSFITGSHETYRTFYDHFYIPTRNTFFCVHSAAFISYQKLQTSQTVVIHVHVFTRRYLIPLDYTIFKKFITSLSCIFDPFKCSKSYEKNMDECEIFQMVMWYLFIFSEIPLTFLNFNFTHILPVLFEARCYTLHKGRAVCTDFLMRKQWESMEGFVYGWCQTCFIDCIHIQHWMAVNT